MSAPAVTDTQAGVSSTTPSRAAPKSRRSFDRPYASDTMRGAGDFLYFELPFLLFAERSGHQLGYATDVDLHADPHLLDGARAVFTLGHDEYWSAAMRNNVVRARDSGVNLAFLGGNEIYRHMRFAPSPLGPNRVEIDYKNFHEDPMNTIDPTDRSGAARRTRGRRARSWATSINATRSAPTWLSRRQTAGCFTAS